MFNFPFFRFPYSNYYYPFYNKYINNNNGFISNTEISDIKDSPENKIKTEFKEKKRPNKFNSFGPVSFINPFDESFNENEPVLEILGLKLYLDDLIILGLLFLLYTEDVHDDILFLALILLLLT